MDILLHDPSVLVKNGPLVVGVVIGLYVLYSIFGFLQRFRTPLRRLRGPPAHSLIFGNTKRLVEDDSVEEQWLQEYGATYATRVIFGNWRLNTIDPRAVAHILSHTEIYPKPEPTKAMLRSAIGEGLVVAEGETHKRQRRIMNPSFSPGQIREVTPIFYDVSYELRDALNRAVDDVSDQQIDIYSWIGRASLDIIGIAGFDYRFNALEDDSNELFSAFHSLVESLGAAPVQGLLRNRFKWFGMIPTKANKTMLTSRDTVKRIGMQLIEEKKAAVMQELESKSGEKKIIGRDLLSALIRANLAADLTPAHQMSDEEVLAQITTFLAAGHETSAAGITWTIFSLSQHLDVQNRLRAELQQVSDETPLMDDLNALPYLDQVVKESLRIHSPIHWTVRTALHDDTIPLSKPVIDRYGQPLHRVRVQAGDFVGVEIMAMNRSKELWGDDAKEFKPERWEKDLQGASEIPGIYAHTLTFIGGPRACIGYRFSVIETKALLFVLLREFEFLPVQGKEIQTKSVIVVRPIVKGEEEKGVQLPMIVRRLPKAG
ncbi:cytochrome P450 [Dacryopinax primogenitus]|uniref:Cytochrome P450 n=1 Tax=Dacryopinax primogenitus (strain DJM 731) TaxID=1858805 RepID=M5G7H1_DACPD|nr:cytochrome P450 [Dacryopinax primogenitus]EJU01812.1 cytochrome P450 [Dacryopinax primogenitus]